MTDRARRWAATMEGHRTEVAAVELRHAHRGGHHSLGSGADPPELDRRRREEIERLTLAEGATLSEGAGHREREEEPDPFRTCFERDRDRILHSAAFRRLAGKTQVFVHPRDHQRTRLTHALEVAQVATAIARAVGANPTLTEAIALGHDCGHGPGGHASEDAFSAYVEEGYDHAVWGADVVLAPLNLCAETLDGIRNHSWSRPLPATPEAEIVSWADRIAYVCHDMEDAAAEGIVSSSMLPSSVLERCGSTRRDQLSALIGGVVDSVLATGRIGMAEHLADALADFREFNYRHVYMRPDSLRQNVAVVRVLQALVEHYAHHPAELGPTGASSSEAASSLEAGSVPALRAAVTWVGGMTDRFAFDEAREKLGWREEDLPRGID